LFITLVFILSTVFFFFFFLPLNCGKLLRERKREKMSNVEELRFVERNN
jgi:hypothetical protein